MINPIQFLENRLQQLTQKFVKIRCAYEFHNPSDAHYVEITPEAEFNKDVFQLDVADILVGFYEMFPGESLVFLTDSDRININPQYIATGCGYNKNWNCLLLQKVDNYKVEPIIVTGEEDAVDYSYALAA